jgi:hypothetical protein
VLWSYCLWMPARGAVQIAAAVLAAAALGACTSGSSRPVALPSLSDSGQASPAASSSMSPGPTASGGSDSLVTAEVEAAVRAYFEAMDLASRSGNGDLYRARTTAACTCREFADQVEQAYRVGRVDGAGVRLEELTVTVVSSQLALVDVHYVAVGYHHVVADRVTDIPSARVHSALRLEFIGTQWAVADEDLLQRAAA